MTTTRRECCWSEYLIGDGWRRALTGRSIDPTRRARASGNDGGGRPRHKWKMQLDKRVFVNRRALLVSYCWRLTLGVMTPWAQASPDAASPRGKHLADDESEGPKAGAVHIGAHVWPVSEFRCCHSGSLYFASPITDRPTCTRLWASLRLERPQRRGRVVPECAWWRWDRVC
jgi:hypothetical protein